MNKNAFFKYVESRGQNAYGSAILIKEPTAEKFSLLIASETVPAVFSSQGSFEFNLVNAPATGKVADKVTLEDKEVEFLLHRDNVVRLEGLKGKTLDFMYFTPDFMGWRFTGTISYRPNDATAEILRGTYTITPMSADSAPIIDARSLVQETIAIINAVEDSVQVGTASHTINVECDVSAFDVTLKVIDGATGYVSTKFTATKPASIEGTTASISVSASGATADDYAILYITVSKTGYAPWTTTVALQGGGTSAT